VRAVAYSLSAITSVLCAILLLRGYLRTKVRLLLWSGLCFVAFSVHNILLLGAARTPVDAAPILSEIPALVGTAVLVFGLIWETRA
jgi:heme/copper-type cytochrome/quinol oxidase subunit 4